MHSTIEGRMQQCLFLSVQIETCIWAVSNRGQTVQPYPKRRTAQTGRGVGRNIWQAIHYIYWDRAYQSVWIADDLPECYGYITRVANLLQTEN